MKLRSSVKYRRVRKLMEMVHIDIKSVTKEGKENHNGEMVENKKSIYMQMRITVIVTC